VPAEHCTQVSVAAAVEKVPAGHVSHSQALVVDVNLPTSQVKHFVEPTSDWYFPIAQLEQSIEGGGSGGYTSRGWPPRYMESGEQPSLNKQFQVYGRQAFCHIARGEVGVV